MRRDAHRSPIAAESRPPESRHAAEPCPRPATDAPRHRRPAVARGVSPESRALLWAPLIGGGARGAGHWIVTPAGSHRRCDRCPEGTSHRQMSLAARRPGYVAVTPAGAMCSRMRDHRNTRPARRRACRPALGHIMVTPGRSQHHPGRRRSGSPGGPCDWNGPRSARYPGSGSSGHTALSSQESQAKPSARAGSMAAASVGSAWAARARVTRADIDARRTHPARGDYDDRTSNHRWRRPGASTREPLRSSNSSRPCAPRWPRISIGLARRACWCWRWTSAGRRREPMLAELDRPDATARLRPQVGPPGAAVGRGAGPAARRPVLASTADAARRRRRGRWGWRPARKPV